MNTSGVELLINGSSRRSNGTVTRVTTECRRNGITLTKVHVVKGRAFDAALESIKERKPELLIVGGGDGTVSRVLGDLANLGIEIGIIPLGTTNNFARSLALPLTVPGAVAAIANGKTRVIDLGKIDNQRFANVAGVGLSAVIADSISDEMKRKFGRLAYALQGIKQVLVYRPFEVTIQDKDNELRTYFQTHQLIIANGKYHAGKEIAVDASLASHELIIFALGGKTRLSLLKNMLEFYIGPRRNVRHSSYLIGKHVRITTNTPQLVEVDGEVRRSTPLDISVDVGAITVRTSK